MTHHIHNRLRNLRAQFDSLKIDAYLVTFLPHLRYLSGFSGSNGIGFVSDKASVLFTDGRYASQVKEEVEGWKVVITQDPLLDELRNRRFLSSDLRIGFDGNTLLYTQFRELKKLFPQAKFLPKVD